MTIQESSSDMKKKCKQCKTIFERPRRCSSVNWVARKYCSRPCSRKGHSNFMTGRKGKEASNWQGGESVSGDGYKMIYNPDHHRSNATNRVREHIIIVEEALKRSLNEKEVIHHIDHNRTNNSLENLYLFDSNSEHSKYHRLLQLNKTNPILQSNL